MKSQASEGTESRASQGFCLKSMHFSESGIIFLCFSFYSRDKLLGEREVIVLARVTVLFPHLKPNQQFLLNL